jgi:NTP pyrophosphatase (non-canonical NTP hydrolase)
MKIGELFHANVSRAARWHPGGLGEWSVPEWAGAMAGEAGEAANAAKKLKRIETGVANINEPDRQLVDRAEAAIAVASEAADTILYALLLMAAVGVEDPEATLRTVFNRTSVKYGFPERL